MADAEEFERMLDTICNGDNVSRKQAEERYHEGLNASPAFVIQALLHVGCTSANSSAANVALVLLGKVFALRPSKKSAQIHPWNACDEEAQSQVKAQLVEFFGSAQEKLLRRAAANCIANLAVLLSSNSADGWPDLWELLLTTIQNEEASPEIRAACSIVFGAVAKFLTRTFLRPHLQLLLPSLVACLHVGDDGLAREASNAVALLLINVHKDDVEPVSKTSIVLDLFHAAGAYAQNQKEEAASDIITCLVALAKKECKLVKTHMPTICEQGIPLLMDYSCDADVRHALMDLILTYAESSKKFGRRHADVVQQLLNVIFQWLQRLEADADWANLPSDAAEEEGDFDEGAAALDRLSRLTAGKIVQDSATGFIMENINGESWEQRVAALTAITYVAEGCTKQFKEHLGMITKELVVPKCADPAPRVRRAALQAIAQLSSDFAPQFQRDHAGDFLPAVCTCLTDDVLRIRGHAASTLSMILEELEIDDEDAYEVDEWENRQTDYLSMAPWMSSVMASLTPALQELLVNPGGNEKAFVDAASSCIEVSDKLATPYVNDLVPVFQALLSLPDNDASKEAYQKRQLMKSSALECLTTLGANVGYTAFEPYAVPTCDYLTNLMSEVVEEDDVRMRYILRGWTCMTECLKEGVLPYLTNVLPRLFGVANMECESTVEPCAAGDDEEDDEEGFDVLHMPPAEGREEVMKVKIPTAMIEDKSLALNILAQLISKLSPEAVVDIADQVLATALGSVNFLSDTGVRDTSVTLIDSLSDVFYKVGDERRSANLLQQSIAELRKQLDVETEDESLQLVLQTVAKLCERTPMAIPADEAEQLALVLFESVGEALEVRNDTEKENEKLKAEAGDSEDEDIKEELRAEISAKDVLLAEYSETVRQLMVHVPAIRHPLASRFLPQVSELLANANPNVCYHVSLEFLGGYVMGAPEEAVQHATDIVAAISPHWTTDNMDVFEKALFATGAVCEMLAKLIPQPDEQSIAFATQAANICKQFLMNPKSKKDENRSAGTYAFSCLVRILEGFANALDLGSFMVVLIQYPQLRGDASEEKSVHDRLARWVLDPSMSLLANPSHRNQVVYRLKQAKQMSPELRTQVAQLA